MDNTIEFIEVLLKLNGSELESLNQVISILKKELVEVDMDTSGFGVTPMTNKVTELAKRIKETSIELRCARQHKHELLLILDNAKEEKQKMTRELRDNDCYVECGVCREHSKVALSEEKAREGCDFCNESEQIQNPYGDIMEMDDGVLILDTEGYPRVTFRIKYCPDCGRELSGNADGMEGEND